jgi:hypothetical protein
MVSMTSFIVLLAGSWLRIYGEDYFYRIFCAGQLRPFDLDEGDALVSADLGRSRRPGSLLVTNHYMVQRSARNTHAEIARRPLKAPRA